ncbi:roadblock/LC7 domain-containing protein [Patescibacteria group bacterium]|nr:roadblock/LC7 domain-containing protein [Patescibacteria group bacterium]MBU4580712.1 roadblock/LC7 domain-containing protein [Patescibacteria group bacterium]
MSLENKKRLDAVLKDILKTEGVEMATIVSQDGIPVLELAAGIESFAAMAAVMFGTAGVMATEAKAEPPTEVIVNTPNDRITIASAGPKAILAVQYSICEQELVQNEIWKAIPKIKTILE